MPAIAPEAFTLTLYKVEAHVCRISLNRPERRNALNRQAYAELESAFRSASADPEVRCVVVTGADPSFCSGDDVREIMTGENRAAATPRVTFEPTPAAMAAIECAKPVIAAVNGPAVGWGMELALYADIRIASEKAVFAELFIKRGLVCDVGGFWKLPSVVGPAKAAELLFTGDPIDAKEAARIGLVSEVVAHEDLMAAAERLAGRIAANPPLAVQAMKQGLAKAAPGDARAMGAWAIETIYRLFQTEDHREGVQSFLEKRAPMFVGR
ncbi:MAG: enoyl-CoA hydratase/isomerase family protein [Caulobacteraceae bacterium]